MRKNSIWLKMIIGLVVFQMVVMPIAPVFAEEISSSTVETIQPDESAIGESILPVTNVEPVTNDSSTTIGTPVENLPVVQPEVPVIVDAAISPIIENTPENILSTTTPVVNQNLANKNYNVIMRRLNNLDKESVNGAQFDSFIQSEKDKLDKLGIDGSKKADYLNFLEKQSRKLNNEPTPLKERIINKVKDILGIDEKKSTIEKAEFRIPQKPASFQFNNNPVELKNLSDRNEKDAIVNLKDMFGQVFKMDQVSADSQYLPTVDDIKADGVEVQINNEIQDLAVSLNNNPVNILNFVRTNISYEPYFGAKKGSVGCLHEGVCNDVDASSLTISLLRAAGIPARYKSSVVQMSADQLKNLLGVDELKTVYIALAQNKVPVYVISSSTIPSGKAIDYDFSGETSLGLEWMFVEAFYDYDERGANFSNLLSFNNASTTADVQNILQTYNNKQWIPMDAVVKNYNRTKNEIVHDTANFNMQNFWNNFLQYQGALSPVQKYVQDLKTATGKDINNASFQSSLVGADKTFPILPPTLPYYTHTGEVGGVLIQPTAYSLLPDSHRPQVKISLLKESDNSVVLENTFYASQVNNVDINLFYEGATDADKQIIESYGGIHATPASLVDITPYFVGDKFKYSTNNKIKIGDQLILAFEYKSNGEIINEDEKFSIAGNSEGIVISLSKILSDPDLTNNSEILLQGNTGLARKYLEHLQTTGELLQKSLDYRFNTVFSRAVITQNRILSEVDGVPTTFDFKGLSIDSGTYINDWSNRGLVTNHRKDFRLIWGQDASYYEGQLFDDITGLTGISTVKGLQFAYAHPETYTVHTITSNNENEIDGLNLSDNTKINMHLAVQEGNTVITPDKAIVDGAWNGLLYIILLPEGCGTYAIGEQTQQNGGMTVDEAQYLAYNDTISELLKYTYYFDQDSQYYAFEDGRSVDSIQCVIQKPQYEDIKNNSGWNSSYGFPCVKNIVNFGSVQHVYILASNGAKFFSSDKYNKWYSKTEVENKVNVYINNIGSVTDKYVLKFSSTLGIYRQSICTGSGWNNCNNGKYETVYFVPDNNSGQVYRLKTEFLDKAANNSNEIIKIVGFPTNDQASAATSKYGTSGNYQNFVNGQMYSYKRWGWTWVYYTQGKITEAHNANGGTNGNLGFPENDPKNRNGVIYQEFEGDQEIGWNLSTGSTAIETFKKYRCELYKDIKNSTILKLIMAQGVFDTVVQTVDDVFSLIMPVIKGVINIGDTADSAYELAQDAAKINVNDITNFLKSTGSAAYNYLIDEYNTSIGPNGCSARANYVSGRIVGEILLIYVPVNKLKAVSKVKLTSKLSEDVKIISKLGDVTENTVETLNGLAKVGKFKGKPIFGIFKKYIDSGEYIWYKTPLDDLSGFGLKQALESGYLKGDLKNGFYSLQKAINDDYLIGLTQKGDEIIYVLQQDGKMIISPRGAYKLPHPILSEGESVRSAGTIKFTSKDVVEIDNSSGHFWASSESLDDVKATIQNSFSNVKVNVIKKYE